MIAVDLSRAPAQRWRPRLLWLLFLAGIVMLAAGVMGLLNARAIAPNRGDIPAAAAEPAAVPPGGIQAAEGSQPQIPVQLRLPSLGIEARVVPVAVNPGGALQVPQDPHVLGWWQAGPRPDSGRGTVVIDGHVDSALDGPGALYRLRDLRPGDQVQLATDHGTREYLIRAIRSFPKSLLPSEVFATEGRPRLVLITCGGSFDHHTHQYTNNIVAYAVPR